MRIICFFAFRFRPIAIPLLSSNSATPRKAPSLPSSLRPSRSAPLIAQLLARSYDVASLHVEQDPRQRQHFPCGECKGSAFVVELDWPTNERKAPSSSWHNLAVNAVKVMEAPSVPRQGRQGRRLPSRLRPEQRRQRRRLLPHVSTSASRQHRRPMMVLQCCAYEGREGSFRPSPGRGHEGREGAFRLSLSRAMKAGKAASDCAPTHE